MSPPPRRPSRRWLYRRRSRQPSHPPVARSPRFLACPMATPSAGRVHSGTTQPPLSLLGGPSRGFSPLWMPRGLPPPTPLRGYRGPLWRPCGPQSFPPLPRGRHFPTPGSPPFPRRVVFAPHGGSVSPPRRPSRRWLSRRRSHWPSRPPLARSPRFLACPMATPSAGRVPPRPPPNPLPMWRRYSRSPRSIPHYCPPPRLLYPPPLWPCSIEGAGGDNSEG